MITLAPPSTAVIAAANAAAHEPMTARSYPIPEGDVWLLDDAAAGVIGQTAVQRQGPPFGWTDEERAESALYLSGSVTDPAAKALRPGSLMARWAVDLAARQGVPWLRRHAQVPQVAAYGQKQGFALGVRSSAPTPGCTCWPLKPSGLTCRPGSGQGSGTERPCRFVESDQLGQPAPRASA